MITNIPTIKKDSTTISTVNRIQIGHSRHKSALDGNSYFEKRSEISLNLNPSISSSI
jgi:hypothetical protein